MNNIWVVLVMAVIICKSVKLRVRGCLLSSGE
jgi:hypothetical protein